MGPNEISKGLLDVICMLLTADADLPLPQQQVFLAGLAYSGRQGPKGGRRATGWA